MNGAGHVESRSIEWSRFLMATALLSTTLAFTALAVGELFWIDDPVSFLSKNVLGRSTRITLLASILGAATVGMAIAGVAALVWGERGANAIERASKLLSPLALIWAILVLSVAYLWQDHTLTFLVLLACTVLLLERSLWASGTAFPKLLIDRMSELYESLSPRVRRLAPLSFVFSCAIVYTAYTGYWSIEQHHRLATSSFDLGILDNLMYNAMNGYGFRSTVLYGPDGGSLLAGHANFVMFLFLPVYWISPRAETLLLLQSVWLGFAAVPLYGFAKTQLPRWSAALLSAAYLLYAPLHGLNFHDFHWLPVSIFFLFCLFWALATNRTVLIWVFWVICVLIREDVSVGLTLLGVFLVFAGYRVRTGVWMAILSLVSFVLIKFVIMTMAGSWWSANLYNDLLPQEERNYGGVLMTLLTNPGYVLSTLLTKDKLIYALHLFAPLAFLPARRWLLLLLAFAGFFFTLMTTNYAPTISIRFQYTAHWIPYLFAATVLALVAMGRSPAAVIHRRAAVGAMMVGVVLHSLAFGAILRPSGFVGGSTVVPFHVTAKERLRYEDLLEVIALIPPDASVAATDPEVPHISNRLTAYPLRGGAGDAEYLLVRKVGLNLLKSRKHAQTALNEYVYGLVANVGDFYLFQRDHRSPDTDSALKKLRLKPGRQP